VRQDTAPIRTGEELPREPLVAWLGAVGAANLAARVWDTLTIEQFPAGHSNLTYLLRTAAGEFVLRRPPVGPLPPKAHDMVREAHVLAAVHPHFPPGPQVLAVCADTAVIGAPFFVMERRHGVVVRRGMPPEYAGIADAAGRISRALIDGLADLHRIDVLATGLITLGRPEGFLERQVAGWSDRWYRAQTSPLPAMDRVIAWLGEHRPDSAHTTLVHNDYKLDNVMLDFADPGRLVAVLDWEMATVGDPLADLGLTLTYWSLPEARAVAGMSDREGWWTRDLMLARYVERTGFDLAALPWHEVLGTFKLAVIVQQIYARYVKGQTSDPRFREMGLMVEALLASACTAARLPTGVA
jgi:aminoglycoside phosphotransferase (APT) family kinase protein